MTDDDLIGLFAGLQRENAGMREDSAAAHADTRRHFEVLAEGTRKDIQIVSESVLHLNEKLTRTDEKIERTAAETQAMIKFSHVEIDRRVRSLEDTVADLQSRVGRLEGSTH